MRYLKFLVLVLAVGATAVLVVEAFRGRRDRDPQMSPRQDSAAGQHELIDARRNTPAADVSAEIQKFFDDFGAAMRAGGANAVKFWDIDLYVRELDRHGTLTRAGVRLDDPTVRGKIRNSLKLNARSMADPRAFDRIEVRSVRWLEAGREAIAVTRHTVLAGDRTERVKIRWWLTHDGGWRIYDHDDLLSGGRVTTASAALIAEETARGSEVPDPVRAAFATLRDARQAMVAGEFENADRLLADPRLADLPAAVQPTVLLSRAMAALALGRPAEALAYLDQAEPDVPDSPRLILQRAACHARMEEWEQALAACRRYVELVGPDEMICTGLGTALLNLDRPAEAAAEYRKALDDLPNSADALGGLVACGGYATKEEVAERFARFPDPARHLNVLVGQAGDNLEVVEALVAVVQRRAPADPEGLFQAGRLRLRKEDAAGAIPLFLKAIENAGEDRAKYVNRFAEQAAAHGKATEAYAALPDTDAEGGFRTLAEHLEAGFDVGEKADPKALESLLAAHRRRKPQDVWLAYYEGVLHHARGDHNAAEKALAAGMGRAPDEAAREQFRWLRVDNLADAGRLVQAYLTVGPRRATFEQLAGRLHEDADLPVLSVLLWLHGWAEPVDPALVLWRAEAAFRGGDYAAAVGELTAYRAAGGEGARVQAWRVRDRLVRSLLRLNRLPEARAELRPADREAFYDRVLDAAITAAGGNVDQTERELDELARTEGATAARFHADPDLSRLLKTPPFQRLLDKYPPPPPGPGVKKV